MWRHVHKGVFFIKGFRVNRKTFYSKQAGYSLVELMVAVGIVSTLTMAGYGLDSLIRDSLRAGSDARAAQLLASDIRERLRYSDLCTAAISSSAGMNKGAIHTSRLVSNDPDNQLQVALRIPDLRAGDHMTSDVLQKGQILPSQDLVVSDLRLMNAVPVDAAENTYMAQIRLALKSSKSNRELHPIDVGTIFFRTNGQGNGKSIEECLGMDSGITEAVCSGMGCTWMTSPVPSCQCQSLSKLCPAGELPVRFDDGKAVCQPLGGTPCPSGQYLTSVFLGGRTCASLAATPPPPPTPPPAPAPTPPVTAGCWVVSHHGGIPSEDPPACLVHGSCSSIGATTGSTKCREWNFDHSQRVMAAGYRLTCMDPGSGVTCAAGTGVGGGVCTSPGAKAICKSSGQFGLPAAVFDACGTGGPGNYESTSSNCHRSAAPTRGTGFDYTCMQCPPSLPPTPPPAPAPAPTPPPAPAPTPGPVANSCQASNVMVMPGSYINLAFCSASGKPINSTSCCSPPPNGGFSCTSTSCP